MDGPTTANAPIIPESEWRELVSFRAFEFHVFNQSPPPVADEWEYRRCINGEEFCFVPVRIPQKQLSMLARYLIAECPSLYATGKSLIFKTSISAHCKGIVPSAIKVGFVYIVEGNVNTHVGSLTKGDLLLCVSDGVDNATFQLLKNKLRKNRDGIVTFAMNKEYISQKISCDDRANMIAAVNEIRDLRGSTITSGAFRQIEYVVARWLAELDGEVFEPLALE